MKKQALAGTVILGLTFSALSVFAQPNLVPATVIPSGVIVNIPLTAIEVAPNVFSLGTSVDPVTGEIVQGFAFITPKDANSHKPNHTGGGSVSTATKCYSFLAQGAKWKALESWLMNPSNGPGLNGATLFITQGAALEKWEDAADGVVGNGSAVQIFGAGSSTDAVLVADTSSPDGKNEVYFADVSSTGAIAVTIVWGIFGGPPFGRKLVEWDQVYDDVDFNWSLTGETGKMDFDNIATHENGHAAGMGHPDDSCAEETMYRFASFGEIKKQTLHNGDIAGINALY